VNRGSLGFQEMGKVLHCIVPWATRGLDQQKKKRLYKRRVGKKTDGTDEHRDL